MMRRSVRQWNTILRFGGIFFLLVLLAGCEATLPLPAEPTLESETAVVDVTETAAPADLDPSGQTIRLWHSLRGDAGTALEDVVDRFNRENEWNIEVTPTYIGGEDELQKRLLAEVQAGEPPALMLGSRDIYGRIATADALADMSEIVTAETWRMPADAREDLYMSLFPDGEITDGSGHLSVPLGSRLFVLMYNQQGLNEIAPDGPPDTLVEFEQQCAKYRSLHERPCLTFTPRPEAVLNLTWMFDGILFTEDGELAVDDEGLHSALSLLRALADNGFVQATTDEETNIRSTVSGKTLFTIASTAELPAANGWGIAPLPDADDTPTMAASGPLFSVLGQVPERRLAAWLFVRWYLLSPQAQADIAIARNLIPIHQDAVRLLEADDDVPPALAQALDWIDQSQALPTAPYWYAAAPTLERVAIDLLNRDIGAEEALEILVDGQ